MGGLLDQLHPARAKWYNLGLALKVHPDDLDAIQKCNAAPDDCLREMLKLWLSTQENPRKEDIIKALQVLSVRYVTLAKELEQEWSSSSSDSIHPPPSHESDVEKQPLSDSGMSAPSLTGMPTAQVGGYSNILNQKQN